jgi:predicted dehydrogenase
MKVAILGASGIGKNHARWFTGHGCEVVSFLGSSPESIAATTQLLRDSIGFVGKGYSDLAALLRETQPDIVCISNPPKLHCEQAVMSLEAGAHVLCEKPLVGDDSRPNEDMIAEARRLTEIARDKKLLLGTQMQYAIATPLILELANIKAGADGAGEPVTSWAMEMETKNIRPGRGGSDIWVDLSPHPLSVLQKVGGLAEIDWESVQCQVKDMESHAEFQVRFEGQEQLCAARVTVRCNPENPVPLRRFTINGHKVDYSARKNETGDFKAFFKNEDGQEIEHDDLVDCLIGNFVAACRDKEPLVVTGDDGAQNVEWQLNILSRASR